MFLDTVALANRLRLLGPEPSAQFCEHRGCKSRLGCDLDPNKLAVV
jgi:hypothetical protein